MLKVFAQTTLKNHFNIHRWEKELVLSLEQENKLIEHELNTREVGTVPTSKEIWPLFLSF